MVTVIHTDNLSKNFGSICAVNKVNLNVNKGEIYGFLGLNGAGKTTTIRMLLGMIRPTSGIAYLCGKKVSADRCDLWEKVGHIVETPSSYPELTVWANLEIMRRLRRISDKKSIDAVMKKLRLTSYRGRKAKHLSLGNKQRLGLAKALLHNPDILILDEPANGLDPAGIVEMRELLRDLASNHGVTIFISSHILGEISKFATRIGIIHEGWLIREVNADQLKHLLNKRLVVNARDKESVKSKLINDGYSVNLSRDGNLEVTDEEAINHPEDIANILVNAGVPPTLLKVEEEDLESYFLRIIGGNAK
ncbi:MAG TPA: bacitracin ABC transporter ATP-binding protein [Clostridiales bacterium]|nr:bacitracin ABC transporter ATP-binding protein [Clostridiales bacterium]